MRLKLEIKTWSTTAIIAPLKEILLEYFCITHVQYFVNTKPQDQN